MLDLFGVISSSGRLCGSFFRVPTQSNPRSYCCSRYAAALGSFAKGYHLPIVGDMDTDTRISSLKPTFKPNYIIRGVIPIVINSLQRVVTFGSWPKISKECGEVAYPLIANFDTSSTVSVIIRVIRLSASTYHSTPNDVLFATAEPMTSSPILDQFSSKASTRFNYSVDNRVYINWLYGAAIALKKPSTVPFIRNSYNTVVALPRHVGMRFSSSCFYHLSRLRLTVTIPYHIKEDVQWA